MVPRVPLGQIRVEQWSSVYACLFAVGAPALLDQLEVRCQLRILSALESGSWVVLIEEDSVLFGKVDWQTLNGKYIKYNARACSEFAPSHTRNIYIRTQIRNEASGAHVTLGWEETHTMS